ncbi:MAG: sulfatase-like hydrolase/transferase [Nannocystaceae bacterium]|nr:sulfatase-like hydrolase/transferase [Nannocystaceae bacterium]
MIAAAVFLVLRPALVDAQLPAHFTHRPPIVLCVRTVLASVVGFALAAAWIWGRQRAPDRLPIWLLGVHYVALRIGAHAAFFRVFEQNLWLLDLAGLVLVGASALALLPRTLSPRVGRALGATGALLATTSVIALLGYGPWGGARAALREQYPGVADIARGMQRSLDLDGDGFASSFGGLDCDDSDPTVSPAAPEIVGNGIDDNCYGGDLKGPVVLPVQPRRMKGRAHSLVFITIDALRADHLDPETMPNLIATASRGAWFRETFAQAPFTDNSMRSLMTGRYPMDFDVGSQFFGQEPSLAELLSAAGYATHVIKVNPLLTPYAFMGFGSIDDDLATMTQAHDSVTSEFIADKAIAAFDRLDAAEAPFLLWVHFFDPHADYVPHPQAPQSGSGLADRYRREVWFTDHHLGRLLGHLSEASFTDHGIVAVTSDHGELLGEHGVSGHANWLYAEALHVPLVLEGIGVQPGPIDTRVRLIDVYPTLLELTAGIAADSDGQSLTAVWGDHDPRDRDVFARTTYGGNLARTAMVGDDKLIQDLRFGVEALYDLASDPRESSNLIDVAPDRADALREAIGVRWDQSVNDTTLGRKQALLPSRQVDPAVWAKFELAVARRECNLGKRNACDRLATLE